VKRTFFLLNAALAMAVPDLISRVHLAAVNVTVKYPAIEFGIYLPFMALSVCHVCYKLIEYHNVLTWLERRYI
jgi:multisubunit Na+/H+ antiporter MnhG subunit